MWAVGKCKHEMLSDTQEAATKLCCDEVIHSAVLTGRSRVGVDVAGGQTGWRLRGLQPGVRGSLGSRGKNSPHHYQAQQDVESSLVHVTTDPAVFLGFHSMPVKLR